MTSFTETFGGSALSPADVAYAAYSFSTNLTLFWPQFSFGQTNVAARFMNMTATANSLNVYMPNAELVSVGYDVLMVNAGSNTFNVVTTNGVAICTIAAGQAFYILLNNNTTTDGTWQVIQFGVGTGAAVAAALAGAGLSANANLLQQNILGTILSSTTTLTSTARAVLQIWNGGSGVVNLPSASSVGNGFFFPFANDGTGSVTVTPNGTDQIDGASTSVFAISQSAFIVSTGTAWFTVGKGLQNNFSVTVLNLNVAGSANITETSVQAQSVIQQFTGILTGNIQVIVPATPQIYFLYNNTTGPYTLTFACVGGGSTVVIAQGSNTIVYCDGTNIVGAFSTTIGSSITLPVGTAGAPTLNFQGRTNTGLYSPAPGQVALTAGGYEVLNITAPTSSVNYLQASAASSGQAVSISALGSDSSVNFNLVPKGSGTIGITSLNATGGSINGTTIGASSAAAITGTTITATSSFTGGAIAVSGAVTGNTLVSTVSTGTAPLIVTSTTPVINLNISGNSGGTTANAVTNSMLAQMPATTIKGNNTGGLANAADLTVAQAQVLLAMQPLKSSFYNLAAFWNSNTVWNFSFSSAVLQTSGGAVYIATNQSLSVNTATSGAGGLDTGTLAASTWYFVYAIYNGSTVSSLFSASATSPALPGGYTYVAGPLSVFITDGSKNIVGGEQYGRNWYYRVGSNLSGLPALTIGASGSVSVPTYTAVSITPFVPTNTLNGNSITGSVKIGASSFGNSSTNEGIYAPNANYGAISNGSNPPYATLTGGGNTFDIPLESTNLYLAQQTNSGSYVLGFMLNI